MKLVSVSYSDIKSIYGDLFSSNTEVSGMPLPGATCAVVGATCTCTSCCFAE